LVQRLSDTTLSISKDKNAHHQKFVNAREFFYLFPFLKVQNVLLL